jgi:hypothetical protein
MAILAHERPEYLEACLDTLFLTNLYNFDITFLICDDGSTNPRVREIISKPRDSKYKIFIKFFPKGPNNAGSAINRAIKYLSDLDSFDIIGWSDPDALYHPEWLLKTMQICLWARKNHSEHTLGPFSSFNSSDKEFHQWFGTYTSPFGDYVVKRQMGMLNYFFFKSDLNKFGIFEENSDDETLKTFELEKLEVRNFCTYNSYIEHLGKDSILNKWRPTAVARPVFGLNLPKLGWPNQLKKFETYGYYKDVKNVKTVFNNPESLLPVEIVICVVEKDYPTLPLTIESIRKNLKHPIEKIHLISPYTIEIVKMAEELNCNFINESEILPFDLDEISYITIAGTDRSRWLFKQLIVMAVDRFVQTSHYFCIDADTILLSPQVFEFNGRELVLHSDEFHKPYYDVYQRLVGENTTSLLSCVAHQMLFNCNILNNLKNHIEEKFNAPWYRAIIDCTDYSSSSGFSEYELYGHWVIAKFNTNVTREYWFNLRENRNLVPLDLESLEQLYGDKYRSISLHSYDIN